MVAGSIGCTKKDEKAKETFSYQTVDGAYLLQNGTSQYRLVIPEAAGNIVSMAGSEFNKFFSESTTVTLPAVSDKDLEQGAKYISLGATDQLKDAGIAYDAEELGRDGYRIVTKDENLYLIGGSDYGTLYAVYELLSYLVDYDFFAKDCYTVKEGVREIPLCDMDLTDIPDIAARTASDGVVSGDNNTLYRMRVRPYLEDFITVNGMWAHNSFQYVQNAEGVNSKWYNPDKTQLCYTARGDKKEYKKMQQATFEALKKELMADTSKSSVTFTMEDNYDSCNCQGCQAVIKEYGTISATVILYLNDMEKMVYDWFETEEGKPYARDLKIMFFAYHGYEDPPASYNEETKKWEFNNGLSLGEHIYCYLAPISMDYYKSVYDKANQKYYDNMTAWTDISNGQLYLWYYSKNYNYYLVPYDNFDSMLDDYQWAVSKGTKYLFDLRQHNESGVVTGWAALQSYMNYKLAWDVEEDMDALYDRFFDGYFGPAAEEMRACFDQMHTLTAYNIDNNDLGGGSSLYYQIVKEELWPKDILKQWLAACDKAEEKIADLKDTDPDKYEMYQDHIDGEKLSFVYLYVECYNYNTSEDEINAYKAEFKQIADRLHLSRVSENEEISSLYEKWGLN